MTGEPKTTLAGQITRLNVPEGMVALLALGQAGFVIKGADTIAVIDACLSDAIHDSGGPERRFPPPINPADLRGVDVVFCTHEHADHTDPATLRPLLAASRAAPAIVSPQSAEMLKQAGIAPERLHVPKLAEPATIKGLRYIALPAAHYDLEINAEGQSRWMGLLIELGSVTLFHAGDTILVPQMETALQGVDVDIALLPINGRDYFREQQALVGNLLPREATEFAHRIGAEVLIPMHNDLFAGNRLNPAQLWDDLDRRFPWQRCHILQPGELYLYVGSAA